MVYMCGTDLESRYGMATKDLMEMASAKLSDKVNILVFTGGCKQWKNQAVSNQVNQIFRVAQGGLETVVQNAGTAAMTDPNNLASFIQWCGQNFPANRNMLIFWDHSGTTVQAPCRATAMTKRTSAPAPCPSRRSTLPSRRPT